MTIEQVLEKAIKLLQYTVDFVENNKEPEDWCELCGWINGHNYQCPITRISLFLAGYEAGKRDA